MAHSNKYHTHWGRVENEQGEMVIFRTHKQSHLKQNFPFFCFVYSELLPRSSALYNGAKYSDLEKVTLCTNIDCFSIVSHAKKCCVVFHLNADEMQLYFQPAMSAVNYMVKN